ncbi:MAG: hypothetical protein KBF78_16100 [Fuscovulum sp.]|jgi:hypothetical protein|nr:hypothetical protein [Fuscovulum sp.]
MTAGLPVVRRRAPAPVLTEAEMAPPLAPLAMPKQVLVAARAPGLLRLVRGLVLALAPGLRRSG